MECNKDEAARAKEIAEKKFAANDLQGAKKFTLKAQALFPGLEGIAHMVATMDIYLASKVKFDGEKDWYSILSVAITADDETLKKQYRKLLLQLHPDKNKSVGAEGAFQMVQEAYAVLSDKAKRAAYDQKRNIRVFQQSTSQSNKASVAPGAANGFYNFATAAASKASANRQKAGVATRPVRPRSTQPPPPPPSAPPPHFTPASRPAPTSTPARVRVPPPAPSPTFWTSCNKCKMNYEYLRVYLDHHLRCPSCREPFLAKEVPMPPTENVVQHSSIHGTNKNASSTRNFQWGSFSRAAGAASATAASAAAAQAANVVHQTYEKVRREREEAQAAARKEEALRRKYNPLKRHTNMSGNVNLGTGDVASSKKMRTVGIDAGVGASAFVPGPGANCFTVPGEKISFSADAGAYQFQGFNGRPSWKPAPPVCTSLTRTFNQLDCRSILLEKAESDLKNKLKELRNGTSQVAASGIGGKKQVMEIDGEDEILATNAHVDPEENNSGDGTDAENEGEDPLSYNVPDSDFHDFDMDRSEESFQSDQIWATYDDEDGMPRYYALIREVLSLKPFKLRISFLTSRTNSEFGPMNWASAGFTKTCGDFRIGKCENNDVLNMFSHQMKWEKGQRGVIKIYPHKGDIWAVYRNWSPDWNDDTPDNVLHAYDVVEVLNDYDEEHGISVVPLVKVAGFQTVFQRNQDPNAAKKIPKEEMFRFSHQVPFYRMSGEEAPNAPKDSYELDPAALSKELLQDTTETVKEANGTLNAD